MSAHNRRIETDLMTNRPALIDSSVLQDTLLLELFEQFLEPSGKKIWLQKIVNLLFQYLNAKQVTLHTYIDNLAVSATDEEELNETSNVFGNHINEIDTNPYWLDNSYVVPFMPEGCLRIIWDKKPPDEKLKYYSNIFSLFGICLKNRSNNICQHKNLSFRGILTKLKNIFGQDLDIKEQLLQVIKEVIRVLNASRCQVKVFSSDMNLIFDSQLSVEIVSGGNLETLSVISAHEKKWLEKIQNHEQLELNITNNYILNNDSSNIESLLSIKSVFGCPLVYAGKSIGVLVLHQCDYERVWREDEIAFIKEITLFLGIVIGKELETKRKEINLVTDINTGLINSDEFLKELNRMQIECQLSHSSFSLIMIDIEKLRDINLEMGFVAGNLVLSQTARYLKRLYGDNFKIARYSNDEFIVIMLGVDQNKGRLEAERLKNEFSNISVLGVGPVDYNFSFVTFPTHGNSTSELLTVLEQAMLLSKSRGKSQVSGYDEVQGAPKGRWQQLVANAIPEIILKKSSLKTGPDVMENITIHLNKQKNTYSADILDSIQSLALALDAKDSYTEGHSKRVAEYASMLAKQLGLEF